MPEGAESWRPSCSRRRWGVRGGRRREGRTLMRGRLHAEEEDAVGRDHTEEETWSRAQDRLCVRVRLR
jgi:hypothetical protein